MKKTVRLTEQQLHNLITEALLTEADWKTYMNAARKSLARARELGYYDRRKGWVAYDEEDQDEIDKNADRMEEFFVAARDTYTDQYNSTHKNRYGDVNLCTGEGRDPYEEEEMYTEPWLEDEDTDDEDWWYGVTQTQFNTPEDKLYDEYENPSDYEVGSYYGEDYDSHVFNNPTRNPHYAGHDYSEEELKDLPPEFLDVHHYNRGDWEWVKGKGWQLKQKNESLAHRVTESVLRKLRRLS